MLQIRKNNSFSSTFSKTLHLPPLLLPQKNHGSAEIAMPPVQMQQWLQEWLLEESVVGLVYGLIGFGMFWFKFFVCLFIIHLLYNILYVHHYLYSIYLLLVYFFVYNIIGFIRFYSLIKCAFNLDRVLCFVHIIYNVYDLFMIC